MYDLEKFEKYVTNSHPDWTVVDYRNFLGLESYDFYDRLTFLFNQLIASAKAADNIEKNIYFGFVLKPDPNACADIFEDSYFISFNTGTLYFVGLVVTRILLCNGNFTHLKADTTDADSLPYINWESFDAEELFEKGIYPTFPKDPIRNEYATYLIEQCLLFILGHEIAHISRGHLDFYFSECDLFFSDFSKINKNSEANFLRQVLELDADRRSIQSRIHSVLLSIRREEFINPPWQNERLGNNQLLFDVHLAFNYYFYHLAFYPYDCPDIWGDLYPNSYVRIFIANISSHHYLNFRSEDKEAGQLFTICMNVVDKHFSNIGLNINVITKLNDNIVDIKKYSELASIKWNEIKPRLQKHATSPLDMR